MKKLALCALLIVVASLPLPAQGRPAITGLAFVRFYTSDAAASDAFYGKTLGYSAMRDGAVIRYPVNDLQWIELVPLPSPAPASRQAAVGFMTRDAQALEVYVKAQGVAIVDPLKDGVFSVHDPEGNLIYFVDQKSKVARENAKAQIPATAVSRRMIHTGFVVKDEAAENQFYRVLLGFKPYWRGGRTDTSFDYVSQQVPNGSDWLEYMLNLGPTPSPKQFGSADHVALGVAHMPDAITALKRNGCEGDVCSASRFGRDGKVQLNLFDPDLTRSEYMEFTPTGTTCCSEYTSPHPTATESR